MSDAIETVAELEACIGVAGTPVKMKIIDHLDAAAARWIAAAPIAFVGIGGANGPHATLAGGAPAARVLDSKTLRVARANLDDAKPFTSGAGAGALFLIPGIGETLRANGRVAAVGEEWIDLSIEECFVHCAKALIRSDFWSAAPEPTPEAPRAFVDATRFLALVTMDGAGRIDISPKGDPAGLLIRTEGRRATLAERPGNRLAFGYRNIIEQPAIAALALIPGSDSVASLRGSAKLSTSEAIRSAFVVDGKTPILGTMIEDLQIALMPSAALARAKFWSGAPPASDIDPAATMVAHLKLNKERGVGPTLLRLAANRGLVASGLQSNYKTDLY